MRSCVHFSDVCFNEFAGHLSHSRVTTNCLPSVASEYHQGCIPAEVRKRAELTTSSPTKPLSETEVAKLNVVAQDAIWTERVVQEKQGAQSWDENWGFMAEFDPKVNVISVSVR